MDTQIPIVEFAVANIFWLILVHTKGCQMHTWMVWNAYLNNPEFTQTSYLFEFAVANIFSSHTSAYQGLSNAYLNGVKCILE